MLRPTPDSEDLDWLHVMHRLIFDDIFWFSLPSCVLVPVYLSLKTVLIGK